VSDYHSLKRITFPFTYSHASTQRLQLSSMVATDRAIAVLVLRFSTAWAIAAFPKSFARGLCLVVYNLGQWQLRQALEESNQTLPN